MVNKSFIDYYAVLNVKPGASLGDIKRGAGFKSSGAKRGNDMFPLPWGRGRPARKRFIGAERPGETPKAFASQIMVGLKLPRLQSYVASVRTPPSKRRSDVAGGSPAPPGEDGGLKRQHPVERE